MRRQTNRRVPGKPGAGIRQMFRKPGSEWRGAPFWSWNDDLDPRELRWQVREMKRGGLGGFFMHNRIGLVTPFMGERWMECIAATVDEARKQGMHAWLYDEDRWPSGFGGGLVVKRNREFAGKYLELKRGGTRGGQRFAVHIENGEVTSYRKLGPGKRPRAGEQVQGFEVGTAPPSGWFNEEPYTDNMDPASVRAFLQICYQPYRRRFAKDFGKTIPGVFTDEPNISSFHTSEATPRIPWTGRLPEEFRRRRGYDLMARLPELFSSHPGFFKTRHDYWRTVTELFAEAYCKQLGEWCGRNKLQLTGHMLCEQEFDQEIRVGGAVMPSLEYMQRPGIDILAEQIRETLTCKQASSVAHQMGRPRTLSETYGTSGWQMSFEGQKWSGDWQTVLGINTRCHHLTPYSLRGMRKRDYPPTFFYHQPWWKYFPVIEDYFARACFFTTIGEPVREVLLLHTISTAWGDAPDDQTRRRHGEHLAEMAEHLLALHYDFDLGDEVIMSRHGSVSGRQLVVGQAGYRLVVIPESETIFATTAELLRKFLAAGGKVIAVRRRPTRIEGKPARELEGLFAHENVTLIAPKRDELEDALRAALPRRVSIRADGGREVAPVIYMERRHQGRSYLMLANRNREGGCRLTVELSGEGGVEQWDLETGRTFAIPARVSRGKTSVEIELPATGSAALVLDPKQRPLARRPARRQVVREVQLGEEWQVGRSRENSLVLDRCQWRFAGGKWSAWTPILLAQKQLRAAMGLTDISHSGIAQPWVRYAKPSAVPPRRVELRFSFHWAQAGLARHRGWTSSSPAARRQRRDSGATLDLVVESAELFTISVNGEQIPNRPRGWWLEKSMDRVPLANVRRGENELVLACDYRDAPEYELEECYLIGGFAVDRDTDGIVPEPRSVRTGDWCDQGYPYYAGNLIYGQDLNLRLQPGERAVVQLGPHFGACVAVHVNGRLAGVRGWAPYQFDITPLVKPGRNRLQIEVCGSPRNLLGPNHLPEKRQRFVGPYDFIRWDEWVEKRNLVPYGLFGEVTLQVQR